MSQPRPDGPGWKIEPEWISWVRGRMKALGLSQRGLAAILVEGGTQATGSAISDLLAGKWEESRLVPAINAALGGDPPVQYPLGYASVIDEVRARIDAKIELLDDEGRKALLVLLEQMTRSR